MRNRLCKRFDSKREREEVASFSRAPIELPPTRTILGGHVSSAVAMAVAV